LCKNVGQVVKAPTVSRETWQVRIESRWDYGCFWSYNHQLGGGHHAAVFQGFEVWRALDLAKAPREIVLLMTKRHLGYPLTHFGCEFWQY
jgi:hypothetical protein